MEKDDPRAVLDRLIRRGGDSYEALSRMIGRNPAYIQQYVKRGSPRRLDERDRSVLARYFGVAEHLLGGPAEELAGSRAAGSLSRAPSLTLVPRLDLGASAGAGSLDEDERASGAVGFDPRWLRDLGVRPERLSIIRVDGESMLPTLSDGDDIMVDHADGAERLRDGIYVLRFDGGLMVKRLAVGPARVSIRSDNSRYRGWEDVEPGQVDIVGRVVWAGHRLT